MGRRKLNPLPKTTISVSDALWKNLNKYKARGESFDQFLTKVLTKYLEFEEEHPILIELLEKTLSNPILEKIRCVLNERQSGLGDEIISEVSTVNEVSKRLFGQKSNQVELKLAD